MTSTGTSALARRAVVYVAALSVLAAAAATAYAANARPGDLDRSFGASGRVLTRLPGNPFVRAIERRRDGRLLVLASGVDGGGALVRYRRNGDLDPSFGTGGKLILPDVFGFDLLLRSDETLVVADYDELLGYRRDGSRDPSFGGGQPVAVPFRSERLAGLPDGGFFVAGMRILSDGSSSCCSVLLARYRRDGSRDESFGGGVVETVIGGGEVIVGEVLVQPDGKVVVSATLESDSGGRDPTFVLRYRPDGSPDTSFGGDGRVELPIDGSARAPLARLPDGRLLVAGGGYDGRTVLFRLRASGSLDRSFGRRGRAVFRPRSEERGLALPSALVLAPRGRIYVGGGPSSSPDGRFEVLRVTRNGSLDRGFGRRGTVSTALSGTGSDQLEGLLVEPGGRLIAGGYTGVGLALARYRTDR